MMKVYKVTPASFATPEARDPDALVNSVGVAAFMGSPMLAHWPTLELKPSDPALLASDFFYFGLGGLAFPQRTLQVFESSFRSVGELLPFTMNGAPFFALNVLRRVAALDVASEVRRLGSEQIVKIRRYAFHPSAVAGESIFQIPEEPSVLFTTAAAGGSVPDFHQLYCERGMTGLEFEELWTDRTA